MTEVFEIVNGQTVQRAGIPPGWTQEGEPTPVDETDRRACYNRLGVAQYKWRQEGYQVLWEITDGVARAWVHAAGDDQG